MVNLKGLFLEMNPLHQTPDPWRSEATASAGNELICNVSDKAPSRPCPLRALNLRCLRGNELLHPSAWNLAPGTGGRRDPGPGPLGVPAQKGLSSRSPFEVPSTSFPPFKGNVRRAPQTNTTHYQSEPPIATRTHKPTLTVTLTHP